MIETVKQADPAGPVGARRKAGRATRENRWAKVAIYVACVLIACTTVGPFVWMLSTSFKLPTEAVSFPPKWIPKPFVTENYKYLFDNGILPFGRFFINSAYIAVLVVIGRLFVCSLGAYGFARLSFPGKNAAFAMLLASLMIPDMLTVIPLFSVYTKLGLINTHFPLIVPPIVANTFGTFLMRQFFMSVPKEFEEAALLDGASHLRIFLTIMLPLSKPALATLAVFTFMNSWNDFFNPLIYLTDVNKFTLPAGLAFFQGENANQYTQLMAGTVLSVVPTLLLFIAAQRYFMRGINLSGLK
jgi:multiple sugar transport system permease protein